jgi:hypothetical protein
MTNGPDETSEAVGRYRRLLALLPERYRREAAEELCQVFADEYADARRRGRGEVGALWLRALADTLLSAPGVWGACLRSCFERVVTDWARSSPQAGRERKRRPSRSGTRRCVRRPSSASSAATFCAAIPAGLVPCWSTSTMLVGAARSRLSTRGISAEADDAVGSCQ